MSDQQSTTTGTTFDRIDLQQLGERVTDVQGNYLGVITGGTSQYGLWVVEAEDGTESVHEGPQLFAATK